jgi:hypothetical protein
MQTFELDIGEKINIIFKGRNANMTIDHQQ